jgi:hypothetical protein
MENYKKAREEEKKKPNPTQVDQDCNWGSCKWMTSKHGNWVVHWWVLDYSCPSSGFIHLLALRSDTLFIYFSKTFLNSHFYSHNLLRD